MAKLVSKTYGDALFDLSVEKNSIDALMEEAEAVSGILEEQDDLRALLRSPKVSSEEKKQVLENVFKGRISDELTGLLCMLLDKSHISEAEAVLSYFVDRCKEYKHIGKAFVTSAQELSAAQKAAVESRLIATTDYVSFEIDYVVDPALMGGIVIRVGDKVLDGSLRSRLDEMARELSKIQISN